MKTKITLVASLFAFTLVLQACSNEASPSAAPSETTNETVVANVESQDDQSETKSNEQEEGIRNDEESTEEEALTIIDSEEDESLIDTSVFAYAMKVDVTDSRDITEHIDLVVHMKDSVKPGLATQHVFTQAYDFLQQDDIKGAKTVTIGIMSGDHRVTQITVDAPKFKPEEHLIKSVLGASTIDKMYPEVKEYGQVMELW
ncbi:hypothetical protein MKY48_27410 [Paenibacillus sp. FSL W8-0187]|uniref:hypothetical protein n=1 Tax=unclassified Paenibacillus TaxID=185978 RepID=UPI0030DD9E61